MSAIDSFVKITVASGASFYLYGGNSLFTRVQATLLTRLVERDCQNATSCREILDRIDMYDYFEEDLDEEKDEDIDLFIDFSSNRFGFPTCKILNLRDYLDWYAATLRDVDGFPAVLYEGEKNYVPFLKMDERIFLLLQKREGTLDECVGVCRFFLDTLRPVESDYLYAEGDHVAFIHCEEPHLS